MTISKITDTNKYDVVVVGSGPAGSTASYVLKKSGLKVLLLEKNTFPKQKLCGGLLTQKTLDVIEAVYGTSLADLEANNVVELISHYYEVYYKNRRIMRKSIDTPFILVNRTLFDFYFFTKVRETGIDIFQQSKVTQIETTPKKMITFSDKKVTADYIVGADGINSIIRKHLAQNKKIDLSSWSDNLALGLQITVPRDVLKEKIDCPRLYYGLLKHGYGWVFPNQKAIRIGIAGINRGNSLRLREVFNRLLDLLGLDMKNYSKIKGHYIPYGNFLRQPGYDGTLLVGDAAGFGDSIFGEGIYYAQKSGELAALAIIRNMNTGKDPCSAYVHYLQIDIMHRLKMMAKFRKVIFPVIESLGYYVPIKLALTLQGERIIKTLHG